MRVRLEWIEELRLGLLRALGEDQMNPNIQVFPSVDPLMVIMKISLNFPLPKGSRESFREYVRAVATKSNCEIPIIHIKDRTIQAEILIKHRHWVTNESP